MFFAYFEYAEYEYNISFLKFECHFAIDIGAPYYRKLNRTLVRIKEVVINEKYGNLCTFLKKNAYGEYTS